MQTLNGVVAASLVTVDVVTSGASIPTVSRPTEPRRHARYFWLIGFIPLSLVGYFLTQLVHINDARVQLSIIPGLVSLAVEIGWYGSSNEAHDLMRSGLTDGSRRNRPAQSHDRHPVGDLD